MDAYTIVTYGALVLEPLVLVVLLVARFVFGVR